MTLFPPAREGGAHYDGARSMSGFKPRKDGACCLSRRPGTASCCPNWGWGDSAALGRRRAPPCAGFRTCHYSSGAQVGRKPYSPRRQIRGPIVFALSAWSRILDMFYKQ